LEFVRVHGSYQAIVVKIVKRLVNTIEILEVGKYQELAISKPFGLVYCQRPGSVAFCVVGESSKREQKNHGCACDQ
jgi:hypothetical protein